MRRLVALDLDGGPAFVDALQRCRDDGDAILPIDQRLPLPARRRLVEAMRPAMILSTGHASARAEPGWGGSGRAGQSGGARSALESQSLPGALPVEDGDLLVVATSGTTGEPKGVVLSASAVEASARATSARLGVDPAKDRWLCALPVAHVGGLSVLTRALFTGTPLEVHRGFDPAAVLEAARDRGATLVSLVPTTLRRLGARGASLFRTVVLGGSAPPSTLAGNVVTTYGMTETGSGVVYDGVPLDGVEIAIAPVSRGAPMPGQGRGSGSCGGPGEILLRGPMLARCYRDGTPLPMSGGYLATGDAGEVGPDGRLVVHGRIGEMVVTGGENVWPAAVEAVIARHPAVAEVAVGGSPDEEWGERVVAYVVVCKDLEGPSLHELRELVAGELGPWAAPRQLSVVDHLPRTAIGKIVRSKLREVPPLAAAILPR